MDGAAKFRMPQRRHWCLTRWPKKQTDHWSIFITLMVADFAVRTIIIIRRSFITVSFAGIWKQNLSPNHHQLKSSVWPESSPQGGTRERRPVGQSSPTGELYWKRVLEGSPSIFFPGSRRILLMACSRLIECLLCSNEDRLNCRSSTVIRRRKEFVRILAVLHVRQWSLCQTPSLAKSRGK